MSIVRHEPEWPPTFAEVREALPSGFIASSFVVDAGLWIRITDGIYSATLIGVLHEAEKVRKIPVVREGANYIADGNILKPLPEDIGKHYSQLLAGKPALNLSFCDVLRLARSVNAGLEVFVDDTIYEPANATAVKVTSHAAIPGLAGILYSYQANGVAWMQKCLARTGGLILADEMGLGKTIQIISLLLLEPPSNEAPALIVCPTTLIANWCREFSRFAPHVNVKVHGGSERTGHYRGLQQALVVIATYDTVVSDIAIFRSVQWSYVITDEAQAIKNPSSLRRRSIVQLPRARSIAVTGTPMENSLRDIWSLTDFSIPGLLGTELEFNARYPETYVGAQELARATGPIIIKRKIADVATELPERIDCDVPLELTNDQALRYEQIRIEVRQQYPVAAALVATGQLQLYCAHPWLRRNESANFSEEDPIIIRGRTEDLMTPKMARTIELLSESFLAGKKVLIFSIYNRIGLLIQEAGSELPKAYWGAINGSTPQIQRQEIVDEFTDYEGPGVLILNPKAAGAGLNITAATIVIHYTQVWNPATEAQASARAHRKGQTQPVTIYRLYYDDTVEKVMMDRSLWRRELANEAVPISLRENNDLSAALKISPLR